MAVPKKKRYKQLIKVRRTLSQINLLIKQRIRINKYKNFNKDLFISKNYKSRTSHHKSGFNLDFIAYSDHHYNVF